MPRRPSGPTLAVVGVLAAVQPATAHWCESGARLTIVERAICSDDSLVNKDRRLNALYKTLGGSNSPVLEAGQQIWLRARNTCTTIDCLHAYYDDRLRVLVNIRSLRDRSVEPQPNTSPQQERPAPSRSEELPELPDVTPF